MVPMTTDPFTSLGADLSPKRHRQSGDRSGAAPKPSYLRFQKSGDSAAELLTKGGGGSGRAAGGAIASDVWTGAYGRSCGKGHRPSIEGSDVQPFRPGLFVVMQSVLRMRHLRPELYQGGRHTKEEEDR